MAELPGNKKYDLIYQNDVLVADNTDLVRRLAKVNDVRHSDTPRGLQLANSGREVWLDIDQETLYEHQSNLEARLAETRQFVATLESRLGNESYVAKAPKALVDESREQLVVKQTLIERLERELTQLG